MHAAGTVAFHERRHSALVREIALAAVAALTYFGVRNLTVGDAAEAFSRLRDDPARGHQGRAAPLRQLETDQSP
jgi:hypothetical protein